MEGKDVVADKYVVAKVVFYPGLEIVLEARQ